MEKKDYIEWLKQWISEKTNHEILDNHENFFENGMLDSFTTLLLVTDIEATFLLNLTDSNLTDSRFSNLDGLANILCEQKGISHA